MEDRADEHICEAIRLLREARECGTKEDVARLAGVSARSVYAWTTTDTASPRVEGAIRVRARLDPTWEPQTRQEKRCAAELSMERIARKVGCSREAVHRWQSPDEEKSISRYLDTKISEYVDRWLAKRRPPR